MGEGPDSTGGGSTSSGGGFDLRLVALCFVLWVVAAAILWQNWPDTKRDYYWGNIMTGLEGQPPRVDGESIQALAAMGDAIIPSCSYELSHHWNPLFKCAVLQVLEETDGKGARDVIEYSVTHDLDARVRANGLMALRSRAKRIPGEAPALKRLAEEVAVGTKTGDPNPDVRSVAALCLGEAGETPDAVKALLVYALRTPNAFFRKDVASAIAHVGSSVPAFDADAKGKDLVKGIMGLEKWLQDQNIALVTSPLTLAPVTSASTSPVTTGSGDGK